MGLGGLLSSYYFDAFSTKVFAVNSYFLFTDTTTIFHIRKMMYGVKKVWMLLAPMPISGFVTRTASDAAAPPFYRKVNSPSDDEKRKIMARLTQHMFSLGPTTEQLCARDVCEMLGSVMASDPVDGERIAVRSAEGILARLRKEKRHSMIRALKAELSGCRPDIDWGFDQNASK